MVQGSKLAVTAPGAGRRRPRNFARPCRAVTWTLPDAALRSVKRLEPRRGQKGSAAGIIELHLARPGITSDEGDNWRPATRPRDEKGLHHMTRWLVALVTLPLIGLTLLIIGVWLRFCRHREDIMRDISATVRRPSSADPFTGPIETVPSPKSPSTANPAA